MLPDALADMLEVFEAVDFGDFDMFNLRRELVANVGLDEATIAARVRVLQVARLAFHGRRFDVEIAGVEPEPAALMGVLDAREEWLDLAAWPLNDPQRVATFRGAVAMLGEHLLDAIMPPPIQVHRTAIAWLRGGCSGVVPIDRHRAARAFLDFAGELVAEDDAHGRELAAARADLVDRHPRILVRDSTRRSSDRRAA